MPHVSSRPRQRHIHINLIPRHEHFARRIFFDNAQLHQRGDIGVHILVMPPQLLRQRVNRRRNDALLCGYRRRLNVHRRSFEFLRGMPHVIGALLCQPQAGFAATRHA